LERIFEPARQAKTRNFTSFTGEHVYSKHWRNGDKSLAAIHLAQGGLGKLDAVGAYPCRSRQN
jgi:hypothetical protein